MMFQNHPRGTAFSSRIDEKYKMAGKTGTSQVRFISKKEREGGVTKNEDLPWNRRDHALFVGYAPYKKPTLFNISNSRTWRCRFKKSSSNCAGHNEESFVPR